MLCLKERNSQKRNTQNLNFKKGNCSRFYSRGQQRTVVKKSLFNSVLPHLLFFFFFLSLSNASFPSARAPAGVRRKRFTILFLAMTAALLSLACWYFHISRIADRLGYDMGRGVVNLCWTCLETCLELPKSRYLIYLYSDLMDQFEGSSSFDDHHMWKFTRDYFKITLELYRSLCLHKRGSWHFWSSDPCAQWLMTADVLERSPTLRPSQFNDGARP